VKINVEIDCTPEEARKVMGLPDLTPLHDVYLAQMRETMQNGISPELIERMVKSWSPMGEAGMSLWRQMFEQATSTRS
jgi:Family of unknown function (DUF6489)